MSSDGIRHGVSYIFELDTPLCTADTNPDISLCTVTPSSSSADITVGTTYYLSDGGPQTAINGWSYRGYRNGDIGGTTIGSTTEDYLGGYKLYQIGLGKPTANTNNTMGRVKLELIGNIPSNSIGTLCLEGVGTFLASQAKWEKKVVNGFAVSTWHWNILPEDIDLSGWSYSKTKGIVLSMDLSAAASETCDMSFGAANHLTGNITTTSINDVLGLTGNGATTTPANGTINFPTTHAAQLNMPVNESTATTGPDVLFSIESIGAYGTNTIGLPSGPKFVILVKPNVVGNTIKLDPPPFDNLYAEGLDILSFVSSTHFTANIGGVDYEGFYWNITQAQMNDWANATRDVVICGSILA